MDQIQRKLAEIDRRLGASPAGYFKQIISTAPLLFCAIGLMGGIIVQNFAAMSVWVWLTMLGLCAVTIAVLYVRTQNTGTYAPVLLSTCALVCFVCVGAIRLASFYRASENDISTLVGGERRLATIRGLIVSQPYADSNQDWAFAKYKFADSGSSFYLRVQEAETTAGWAKAGGTIRVQVDEAVTDLQPGDYVQLYCWLEGFQGATNPGQFDIREYLARKGVTVGASVKTRDGIELLQNKPVGIFAKIKARLRQAAVQALVGERYPNEESEKLLLALVLGYRANIDKTTLEAFRRTGLLHFICLSGMNFGILIGIVWWVCKTVGLMKPARAAVCMITAVMFLSVVPENAPAFRAAIICFAFCGSILFRRQVNPFNSLALAAVVLLLIRPTELFEADWQLSFASVLGILTLCPRFYTIIREKTVEHPWLAVFMKVKNRPFLIRIVERPEPYAMFSTSLAAWSASAGILLYQFGTIQPMTSIWTVIVSPLIGVISVAGYVKLVLAMFVPNIANVMDNLIMPFSDLLIWVVKFLASIDETQMLIGQVPAALIILYYGLIAFAAFAYFRRPMPKRVICTVIIIFITMWIGIIKWERAGRNDLAISVLDVGHGQAIVAQLPGTTNILFDAGSLTGSDIGRRIVVPFLQYNGISRINVCFVSHNDTDHINGVPEIAEYCKVGGVYANEEFFDQTDQWGTAKFFKDQMRKRGVEVRPSRAFPAPDSSAIVKILWPSKDVYENEEVGENDKSSVCLIEFAGRKVLLCSDIEEAAQQELLRLYPDLRADIVIVPHHGSARTLEANFLEALSPDIIISSCGDSAIEKGLVVAPGGNTREFYTARDGAITVRVDRSGKIEAEGFVRK